MQMVAKSLINDVDVIFAGNDNTIASAFDTLAAVSEDAGVPIISGVEDMVEKGALAGLASSQKEMGLESAKYGIRILEGESPATLPIKFLDDFTFVYNGQSAEKLNIKLPESLTKEGKDLSK